MDRSFLDKYSEKRKERNMICSGQSANFIGDHSS